MTGTGTLYVEEDCRDAFEIKLNKWYGKDKWNLDGGEWGDVWQMEDMPKVIKVNVMDDEQEKVIGKVEIKNKRIIQDFGNGMFIDCEPKSIKRIK